MKHIALALGLALAVPATSGCTEEAKARFEADQVKRKREAQRKILLERADEYWTAVRWQNWADAAMFLEEGENQLLFLRDRTSGDVQFPTMDDVEVDYVFVDGETFKKAEVRTSWTEFKPPARMAEKKSISQRWYKANGWWWITPEEVLPPLEIDDEPAAALPAEEKQ